MPDPKLSFRARLLARSLERHAAQCASSHPPSDELRQAFDADHERLWSALPEAERAELEPLLRPPPLEEPNPPPLESTELEEES